MHLINLHFAVRVLVSTICCGLRWGHTTGGRFSADIAIGRLLTVRALRQQILAYLAGSPAG